MSDRRHRWRVQSVVAVACIVVGVIGWALAARDAIVWHHHQRDARRDLTAIIARRAADGSTTELEAAAAARALDDDLLVLGAGLFGGGAILIAVGIGTTLGRVRQRQARVALHPSLVAAADRKLERILAEHAQDLVTMLDDDGRFTYVSPSVTAVLGYDPAELLGTRFDDVLEATMLDTAGDHDTAGDDDRAVAGEGSDDLRHGEQDRRIAEPVRHRALHADGSTRWLETLSHRIDDDRAVGTVTLYSSRDVTERVRLEETLAAERRLLGDTLANIHAGILSIDLELRVIEANVEFVVMVGFRPEPGMHLHEVEARYRMVDVDGAPVPPEQRPLQRAARGESVKQFAATLIGEDGTSCDVMLNAGPLVGADAMPNGAVITLHDVSELRAAEAELRSLATVDMLTGLPNRRHLASALTEAMSRNADSPERLALLFLDLDGFKAVNDTYGHQVGDQVLRSVGGRIVSCLRGGDVVARLGGDEFVVVVEHLNAPTDVLPLVARIERALGEPFDLDVGQIRIGASVGIASAGDVTNAAELLARADAAMYACKRLRSGRTSPPATTDDPGGPDEAGPQPGDPIRLLSAPG